MNWPKFHKSLKIFEEQHQETFKEVKILRKNFFKNIFKNGFNDFLLPQRTFEQTDKQ